MLKKYSFLLFDSINYKNIPKIDNNVLTIDNMDIYFIIYLYKLSLILSINISTINKPIK